MQPLPPGKGLLVHGSKEMVLEGPRVPLQFSAPPRGESYQVLLILEGVVQGSDPLPVPFHQYVPLLPEAGCLQGDCREMVRPQGMHPRAGRLQGSVIARPLQKVLQHWGKGPIQRSLPPPTSVLDRPMGPSRPVSLPNPLPFQIRPRGPSSLKMGYLPLFTATRQGICGMGGRGPWIVSVRGRGIWGQD